MDRKRGRAWTSTDDLGVPDVGEKIEIFQKIVHVIFHMRPVVRSANLVVYFPPDKVLSFTPDDR